jgi:hemerythrin-like domain-containing protein
VKVTDILSSEHRVIEQVLDSVKCIVDQAHKNNRLDIQDARDAVDFFRMFADRCHHGKEESLFFPMLETKGFDAQGGPTGVMRAEHEQGREYVRQMKDALELIASGKNEALEKFARNAKNYIMLLHEHIQKEDHCLFGMANQVLRDEDHQELINQFEHVEHNHMGEGVHEKYLSIANRLADKYGVERADIPSHVSSCGHHH